MKYDRVEMSKAIPVRLDKALVDRIKALSERIGEAQSTVMRIAMRLGLESLEKGMETKAVRYPGHSEEIARAEDKPSSGRGREAADRIVRAEIAKVKKPSGQGGPPQ